MLNRHSQSNLNDDSFYRTSKPSRSSRRGMTSVEILVSVGVLLATVSLITTLVFKCGMIWKDVSQHRVALHELSSHLEELTLLDTDTVAEKLKQLEPSLVCTERLPEAKLTGSLTEDNIGVRVQLALQWKRPVESKPIVLCGWLIDSEDKE